ncbi:hypothetical protein ONZ43_g6780 [Nemania bipapillata]|uniref:Uncharacterized protein n=1 Tax=Nemania bipapillata TaxID=110536 RepID=A0ACC2HW06_9PEZI|nr:hypothetical protein ONZ43_g6780 [Nemania bipapillata]
MALQLVAGHAFNNLGLANILPARDLTNAGANMGAVQARADVDTVHLFIDSTDAEITSYGYAASVVNACESYTVYAVQCTAGDSEVCGTAGVVCASLPIPPFPFPIPTPYPQSQTQTPPRTNISPPRSPR